MGILFAAFSEEHTERLTGVTVGQLRHWDRSGFFRPAAMDVSVGRVYSFRDIVSLRVLGVLRNQYGVSLQHLRQVSEKLSHLEDDRWTGVRMYVLNRCVVWQEPGTERPQEIVSKQYVVPTIELDLVVADTKRDVQALNARKPEVMGHVEKSRFVNHNAPVVAGTRVRVRAIKRFAEAGYSVQQIIEEYPDLSEADVRAALKYGEVPAAA